MSEKLWLVGQFKSEETNGIVWEFAGIYDTRENAVAACRTWEYFVTPVTLNKRLPHKKVTMPGCFYPLGIKA